MWRAHAGGGALALSPCGDSSGATIAHKRLSGTRTACFVEEEEESWLRDRVVRTRAPPVESGGGV